MSKKIRWAIVAGQIALLVLGISLFVAFFAAIKMPAGWWYKGPPPALFFIGGIMSIVGAVILLSLATYEARD